MASLDSNPATNKSTILLIGNNGAGKSGALASLALAGYKLRIVDCDNGTEILRNILTPTKDRKLYTKHTDAELNEARARIDVETCQDTYAGAAGNPLPKLPLTGFSRACKVLDAWPGLGKPSEWDQDTILVLDSLTLLGKYIMNHVLSINMHLGKAPQLQHWGAAMDQQETLMAMLTGPSIKCHVIVMAHVTFITEEGDIAKQGYPSALGSKLPPKIGSYFNSTLHVDKTPQGDKIIRTQTKSLINCKTSAPGKVPATLPLETGLADYFEALHGKLRKPT
jgi:hypothetical protein